MAYMAQGKNIEAKNDFTKSIAYKRDNYDAYYRRAEVYQKMGKNSTAMRDFGKVIQMNPKDPYPFFERGKYHWKNKEVKLCIEDMTQYIKFEKKPDPEAYYLRGASYFLLKDKDKACKDLVKAKDLGMEAAKDMHYKICYEKK
jgi:tetratricopeptide (TPR) repeat protein